MADRIKVTPAELKTQAQAVRTQLGTMQEAFESLKTRMNATSSFWTGEAGDAHRQRYMGYTGKVDEMIRRYQEQVSDLEKIAGVYEQGEAAAVRMADSLPASSL